jgi:hypothetical protein
MKDITPIGPNNKVSEVKILSSKVPKGISRFKIVLRNAANAIGNLKTLPLFETSLIG